MDNLVSIITPTYNSAEYVSETIKSIQAQTHGYWELLITDDCSTDLTIDIIKSFQKVDKRIKLFLLDKNQGTGAARNKSIKEARGRYIAFCDSDDQWKKTGVIKGSFQETAFDKNGKFNVYLMDRVRALAGAESQNIEIIFVSNDGETASILGNAFAEDLGFKNVYVLKGGIKAWINEKKALVSFLK